MRMHLMRPCAWPSATTTHTQHCKARIWCAICQHNPAPLVLHGPHSATSPSHHYGAAEAFPNDSPLLFLLCSRSHSAPRT